jgi:hypothetical protein
LERNRLACACSARNEAVPVSHARDQVQSQAAIGGTFGYVQQFGHEFSVLPGSFGWIMQVEVRGTAGASLKNAAIISIAERTVKGKRDILPNPVSGVRMRISF